jgi:hypothetical protein
MRAQAVEVNAERGPVADYFPFHRTRTFGAHRFVTIHDLRVFEPDYSDGPGRRDITDNIASAEAIFTSWRNPYREISTRMQ